MTSKVLQSTESSSDTQHKWDIVTLERVLKYRKEFIRISDLENYKRCRVQCHVQGIVLRDVVQGTQIRTKNQQVCKEGDFLVAEIDAKLGGFGIVPDDLEGAIVSSHYYLYEIDEDVLDKSFFGFFIKTPYFRDQVSAQGSTNYAAIRYYDVLGYTMPLPPIAEQRRIVARIEEIAAKIEEARGLREGAIEKLDIFSRLAPSQVFENLVSDTKLLPIGEVISFRNDLIRPTDGKTGKLRFIGLQHVESHSGNRIGEDKLDAESLQGRKFKFSQGEIIYGYLRPYLNKVWVADCDGICSVDQYVIRGNPDKVDVNYLAHFMRSQTFLSQAIDLTHNLQLPRLRTALLEGIKIPLPSLSQQRSLVDYLNNLQLQIKRVKQFREDALQEFDALLPAILDKAGTGLLTGDELKPLCRQ